MVRKALLFLLIGLPFGCFAQINLLMDSSVAKKVNSKLANFLTTHQSEKAYLQLDRPYYMAGDTLYFKAYVTLGEYHELSNLAEVLHVDLINPALHVSQSRTLEILNGVAWGDFILPDSLKKGQYRIRAYTQWMRNGEGEPFFDQAISIGSQKNMAAVGNNNLPLGKPEINFFPEGGTLVEGVKSKLAFKAIATNGLGTNVKGVIVDNDNIEVASFTSAHLGMGYFELTPAAGKTYKAKVTYANGSQDMVSIPAATTKGITLSMIDKGRYADIDLQINDVYLQENKNKFYTISVYCGGAATNIIGAIASKEMKTTIDKQQFPSGVARVTLFSSTGEPLAERLLFIKNNDVLKLNIASDKAQYAKRENTIIQLGVADGVGKAAQGHFSVSVIDEGKMPPGESNMNNIFSDLLLTSELSGNIENPAYYFGSLNEPAVSAGLDLVMLTHGYRKFEWKKLMNDGYEATKYPVESDLKLTGTVKTTLGKPIANTNITITAKDNNGIFAKDTVTDANGGFKFLRLSYADNTRFLLKTKGGNNVVINYNEAPLLPVNGAAGLPDTGRFNFVPDNVHDNYIAGADNSKVLKEVNVKDSKAALSDQVETVKMLGNKVFYGKDMIQDTKLSTALNQIGGGLDFRASGKNVKKGVGHNPFDLTNLDVYLPGGSIPAMLVVDGVEYQGNIDDFSVDIISSIEILDVHSQSKKFYGALNKAEGGVIVINTDRNKASAGTKTPTGGTLYITPQGFYKAREFYVPKYSPANINQAKADLRSTIYWQPELVTDKNGNSTFSYANADGTGNYLVVIEGIDNNGNLGSARYTYKVQ